MRLEELRNIFHIAALLLSKKWDWKFMLKATKLSDDLVLSSFVLRISSGHSFRPILHNIFYKI